MTIKNRILLSLCHEGPASRAELAKRLELSASHISEAVSELISKNILVETGYRQNSSRGRKNTLLDFNLGANFALGVGFNDDLLSVGITTVRGDVLGKEVMQVDFSLEKEDLLRVAFSLVAEILRNCCLTLPSLLGVGLCFKEATNPIFYADSTLEEALADAQDYIGLPTLFEPAEQYLQADPRITPINPEELYLFGAAKVIRDLLLYADI